MTEDMKPIQLGGSLESVLTKNSFIELRLLPFTFDSCPDATPVTVIKFRGGTEIEAELASSIDDELEVFVDKDQISIYYGSHGDEIIFVASEVQIRNVAYSREQYADGIENLEKQLREARDRAFQIEAQLRRLDSFIEALLDRSMRKSSHSDPHANTQNAVRSVLQRVLTKLREGNNKTGN
ncbi:MAG: hypothetical protein AAFR21_11020 [Pseudomonadota bacterium]